MRRKSRRLQPMVLGPQIVNMSVPHGETPTTCRTRRGLHDGGTLRQAGLASPGCSLRADAGRRCIIPPRYAGRHRKSIKPIRGQRMGLGGAGVIALLLAAGLGYITSSLVLPLFQA